MAKRQIDRSHLRTLAKVRTLQVQIATLEAANRQQAAHIENLERRIEALAGAAENAVRIDNLACCVDVLADVLADVVTASPHVNFAKWKWTGLQ